MHNCISHKIIFLLTNYISINLPLWSTYILTYPWPKYVYVHPSSLLKYQSIHLLTCYPSLSTHLSTCHLPIYLPIYLSIISSIIYIYLLIYPSTNLSTHLFTNLPIYNTIYHIHISNSLSIYSSTCLSTHPSINQPLQPLSTSLYLSISLSVIQWSRMHDFLAVDVSILTPQVLTNLFGEKGSRNSTTLTQSVFNCSWRFSLFFWPLDNKPNTLLCLHTRRHSEARFGCTLQPGAQTFCKPNIAFRKAPTPSVSPSFPLSLPPLQTQRDLLGSSGAGTVSASVRGSDLGF